jgi:hypothetical protein
MSTDYDTARSQYDNYRFCYDNGHAEWVAKARTCFEFWNSKQWSQKDINKNLLAGKPSLTLNIIESLIRTMSGVQQALRNDVRYAAWQNASQADAQVRDSLWLHAQQANDYEFLETNAYIKGLIMGRAYLDVRISRDNSMMGWVKIRGRRSQDVILDPSIETYDPAENWPQVITRRYASYADIKNLFGVDKAEAVGRNTCPEWMDYEDSFLTQQMGRLPYYQSGSIGDPDIVRSYLLIDRQYKTMKRKECFVDLTTGEFREIPETWDRNRIADVIAKAGGLGTMYRMVNTVRWAVTCDHVVMHDEDSPYDEFTTVPFFPSFIDGVSKGIVEDLIDPQQLYNKMTSSELHIISTTANSGYKVKVGALKNMTPQELEERGARAGFVAELDDVNHLEKITPNQVPAGHDRLSYKADLIMRQLAGTPNGARGFARDDASGDKVMQDQAGQDLNAAAWLGNLHYTKKLVARRVLDCQRAYYTETRVLQINHGSTLVPKMQELTINQPTPEGQVLNDISKGAFTTVLVPSPSRTTMSEADFKLMLELRKLGIGIPDQLLIELSPASNKSQIIQALVGDSNERQAQMEQAEVEKQAIEAEKTLAMAEKEKAAAALNMARAEKFAVEAASDPDASYERVESARIAAEQQQHAEKLALDRQKQADTKQYQNKQVALQLAKLDNDREIAEAKAKEARKASPRRGKEA